MKTRIVLILLGLLAALSLSGCFSPSKIGKDYAAFIKEIPAATITDVSTKTVSPFWNFDASASGISTDPKTGLMTITNGKASFGIPLWGFNKTFAVSGFSFRASPEQLALAASLQASVPSKTP